MCTKLTIYDRDDERGTVKYDTSLIFYKLQECRKKQPYRVRLQQAVRRMKSANQEKNKHEIKLT